MSIVIMGGAVQPLRRVLEILANILGSKKGTCFEQESQID